MRQYIAAPNYAATIWRRNSRLVFYSNGIISTLLSWCWPYGFWKVPIYPIQLVEGPSSNLGRNFTSTYWGKIKHVEVKLEGQNSYVKQKSLFPTVSMSWPHSLFILQLIWWILFFFVTPKVFWLVLYICHLNFRVFLKVRQNGTRIKRVHSCRGDHAVVKPTNCQVQENFSTRTS